MAVPTLPLKPGQLELVRSVVARLRQGNAGDFIRPWRSVSFAPRNGITGRQYGGYNRFATTFVGFLRGYSSPLWLTEKQITDRGGQILPDQVDHSIPIVFTGRFQFVDKLKTRSRDGQKPLPMDGAKTEPPRELVVDAPAAPANSPVPPVAGATVPVYSTGYFIKEYSVYNLAQTSGVRLPKKIAAMIVEQNTAQLAETPDAGLGRLRDMLLRADVAPLFWDRTYDCYYDPGRHEVHAPREHQFISELDKWEAIAHETIHATGARHLLNRPTIVDYKGAGSKERKLEELTAVMGSLFICQDCGVPVTPERERNWTAYLSGHDAVNLLEKDPSLFVRSLIYADFAAQFVIHPENRPQFIRDRPAPNQIEFSFDEFSHDQHAVFPDEVVMPEALAAAKAMDESVCSNEQHVPTV